MGGVGRLNQGDFDLGRLAVERLRRESHGPRVVVEELSYGAVAVAQRLQELCPDQLILVGAVRRGRAPGEVTRRRVGGLGAPTEPTRHAVAEAATGYVSIDLVLEVGSALGALPFRTVVVEVEPATAGPSEPSEAMSIAAEGGLEVALDLVRAELRRAPLMELSDVLRELASNVRARVASEHLTPSPAYGAFRDLLNELAVVEHEGRWGRTFAFRDRLRGHILAAEMGPEIDQLDHMEWSLIWALIEELDRLERLEGSRP